MIQRRHFKRWAGFVLALVLYTCYWLHWHHVEQSKLWQDYQLDQQELHP